MGIVWLGWMVLTSAWADCSAEELGRAVDHVEVAFASADARDTRNAAKEMERRLVCIDEPLRGPVAARVHRASALARFLRGDERGVDRALRGMVHADPRLALPDTLPADHPLRGAKARAEEAPVEWRRGPVQWVNGVRTGALPRDHDVIVQVPKKGHLRTRLK